MTNSSQKKVFKIRASMIGAIMSEPKSKSETLSKTAISYLDDWIKETYFGRRKQLKTGAIQKGIECENEAIFVLNKALGTDFKKSKGEKMENERCTGSEDIDDTINFETRDTKVCESFDSFPILKEELDKNYWRQGQGYMRLKGENYMKHTVAKVLVNSPTRQISQKLYYAYNDINKKYEGNMQYVNEEYAREAKAIFLAHVFDTQVKVNSDGVILQLSEDEVIPYDKRVNCISFARDNDAIEKIKIKVQQCRDYLEQQLF